MWKKDEFYMKLQGALDARKTHDMLIVTGDMNPKVEVKNWDYTID